MLRDRPCFLLTNLFEKECLHALDNHPHHAQWDGIILVLLFVEVARAVYVVPKTGPPAIPMKHLPNTNSP